MLKTCRIYTVHVVLQLAQVCQGTNFEGGLIASIMEEAMRVIQTTSDLISRINRTYTYGVYASSGDNLGSISYLVCDL